MPRIDLPGSLGSIDIVAGLIKRCQRTQWGEGVLVDALPPLPLDTGGTWRFADVPAAVVADGAGGAFVLTTRTEGWPGAQGPLSLRHLPPSGVPGPLVAFEPRNMYIGVIGIWGEAALVASGSRRAIVVRADHSTLLSAYAFDDGGNRLWPVSKRDIPLSGALGTSRTFRVLNIAGEPDGREGAIFVWRAVERDGVLRARAQRIDRKGRLQWGRDGVVVPLSSGSAWPPPQSWMQLVTTPTGGAIVVASEAAGAGFRLQAVAIDPKGTVGSPVTVVAATADDLISVLRVRTAVADRSGGLLLAYVDLGGTLRLLRYVPGQGSLWDTAIATPLNPQAYWIREDDAGGALLAWLAAGGNLAVQRYDAQGAIAWTATIAPLAAPMTIELPPSASTWGRETWARLVQVMPDGGGGAICVFQSWSAPSAKFELRTCCFGADGVRVNDPQEVSTRASGKWLPVAAPVAGGTAVVAWADDGTAAIGGVDCFAQRIACCLPQGEPPPPPPFGCEILVLPGTPPGEIAMQLPCGNETRAFGVMALSRLVAALGSGALQGGLVTDGIPPPAWVRLAMRGVPAGFEAWLITATGRTLARARPVQPVSNRTPLALEITFRPPRDNADLIMVVSVPRIGDRPARFGVHFAMASGQGKPPSSGTVTRAQRPRAKRGG